MSNTLPVLYPTLEAAIEGTLAPPEIIKGLALVEVDFVGFDDAKRIGQIVVAETHAQDIQEIFGKIRDAKFPIGSMVPISFYGNDDHTSIAAGLAGNTSGFCYRVVAGTDRLSQHALGRAIDINPRLNPYMNTDQTPRAGSFPYPRYQPNGRGVIRDNGPVVRAFLDHGWEWGGHWTDALDLQHFNKG